MKNVFATTAIVGLMAFPAFAQSQTTAPANDQMALAVHDLNNDGKIDESDLKLADTNGDGVVDAKDMQQIAVGTDATKAPDAKAADAPSTDTKVIAAAGDANKAEMAKKITGEKVYDSKGDSIGEVSELVVDGDKTFAIIDVGGFLGMGEKPVALDLSRLNITADPDGKNVKVTVDMTKEQLEALPDYKKK